MRDLFGKSFGGPCPKCGQNGTVSGPHYLPAGTIRSAGRVGGRVLNRDALEYRCSCGYSWTEPCKDEKDKGPSIKTELKGWERESREKFAGGANEEREVAMKCMEETRGDFNKGGFRPKGEWMRGLSFLFLFFLFLSIPAFAGEVSGLADWTIERGRWGQPENGKLKATGDSSATFKKALPADTVIEMDVKVLNGIRPRIHFKGPDFFFGNEGPKAQMNVHGPGATAVEGSPFAYEHNKVYRLRAEFKGPQFTIQFGDSKWTGQRRISDTVVLCIQGGDGWSAGETEFSNFKVGGSNEQPVGGENEKPDEENGETVAPSGNGRAFIRSAPAQAEIFLRTDGKVEPTGQVTPSMIKPPLGEVEVVLRKEGYQEAGIKFSAGDSIAKPDVVQLVSLKHNVDITFAEADWQVFVDGKAVNDVDGKAAKTPCTIELPDGAKEISIAKEGFGDMTIKAPADDQNEAAFKNRPIKGKSRLISLQPAPSVVLKPICNSTEPNDGDVSMLQNGKIGNVMDGLFCLSSLQIKFDMQNVRKINGIVLYPFLHRDGAVCKPSSVKVYASNNDGNFADAASKNGYILVKEFTDDARSDDPRKGVDVVLKQAINVRYVVVVIDQVIQSNVGKRDRGAVSEIEFK